MLQVLEDTIKVEWDGLETALEEIRETLVPDMKLEAQFYKLLVYQPGDFFHYHSDSKKHINHNLTLAVDCTDLFCTGGEVFFREGRLARDIENIQKDNKHPVSWKSSASGDWCCWFASIPHRVNEVVSGYRVIATYNVLTEPKAVHTTLPSKIEGDTSFIGLLLPEVREILFDTISATDLSAISRTCRKMHESFGSRAFIFSHMLKPYVEYVTEVTKLARVPEIGFVLQNRYSFDGKEELDIRYLRGRDYILARALADAFKLEPYTREVRLVEEYAKESEDSPESTNRFRVSTAVFKPPVFEYEQFGQNPEDKVEVPENIREAFSGKTKLARREFEVLENSYWEKDDPLDATFVPFRGVSWFSTANYLIEYCVPKVSRKRKAAEDCFYNMWGNAAIFALYWYKDAALLLKLHDDIPDEEIEFSLDIQFSASNDYLE